MVVAIILAFSINVDPIKIFKTYLSDKNIRSIITATGGRVVQQLEKQQKSLDDFIKNPEGSEKPSNEEHQQQVDAIVKKSDEINVIINDLKTSGIPIGYDFAPWEQANRECKNKCEKDSVKDTGKVCEKDCKKKCEEKCENEKYSRLPTEIYVRWFVSVLLGGFLIGLGGPFWFNVFQKFTAFSSIARRMQSAVQKPKEQATIPVTGTGQAPEESDPVKIFETAAMAKAFEREESIPPRPLLDTNGNVIGG